MFNTFTALPYPKYKLTILALLSLNVFIYMLVDTWVSAVDALAWVILLVMFELETLKDIPFNESTLHKIRNGLIAVIAMVLILYLFDNEWLDIINSILWFGLIALLELEVRQPEKVQEYGRIFWVATIFVFTGLIGLVGVWAWQGSWLDAYDAALWIAAFGVIEVDIFRFLKLKRG